MPNSKPKRKRKRSYKSPGSVVLYFKVEHGGEGARYVPVAFDGEWRDFALEALSERFAEYRDAWEKVSPVRSR
jgi:hypothetical protein